MIICSLLYNVPNEFANVSLFNVKTVLVFADLQTSGIYVIRYSVVVGNFTFHALLKAKLFLSHIQGSDLSSER